MTWLSVAAREAIKTIERTPGIGSPRLGQLAEVDGLRSWPVKDFPVRWFYFERMEFVDVVRLLGERQDIAAILEAGLDCLRGFPRQKYIAMATTGFNEADT